jgi:SnoaL-like domain
VGSLRPEGRSPDADLERSVRNLMDRTAITDVLVRYFTAVDAGRDLELLATCFADDVVGVFEGITVGRSKAELLDFFAGKGASPVPLGADPTMMHVLGNVTVEFDQGDPPTAANVVSNALAHLIDTVDGAPRMRRRGLVYRDRFVKVDGRWLIAQRTHSSVFTVFDAL